MTIKIMPFSPTSASVARPLLTNSRLQFGNWPSCLISIKSRISQMSPLYTQLENKRFCPNTDRIMMKIKKWLTLLSLKIKDEATFLGLKCPPVDQPLGMLSGIMKKHCSLSIIEHHMGYAWGPDQRKAISQKQGPPLAALVVIHNTSVGLTLKNLGEER